MKSEKDEKYYSTDVLDTKGILRLIEFVPSPRAESMKMWLANLGSEKIDEVFDSEIAIKRAIEYYKKRGYSDSWIESRIKEIINRNKLTDTWKEHRIDKNYEYAILTSEIYKEWSGMTANEYKDLKGIRKESLRDNMTDIEITLTDLGEIAKNTKEQLEKELEETVISNKNMLPYHYKHRELENKK